MSTHGSISLQTVALFDGDCSGGAEYDSMMEHEVIILDAAGVTHDSFLRHRDGCSNTSASSSAHKSVTAGLSAATRREVHTTKSAHLKRLHNYMRQLSDNSDYNNDSLLLEMLEMARRLEDNCSLVSDECYGDEDGISDAALCSPVDSIYDDGISGSGAAHCCSPVQSVNGGISEATLCSSVKKERIGIDPDGVDEMDRMNTMSTMKEENWEVDCPSPKYKRDMQQVVEHRDRLFTQSERGAILNNETINTDHSSFSRSENGAAFLTHHNVLDGGKGTLNFIQDPQTGHLSVETSASTVWTDNRTCSGMDSINVEQICEEEFHAAKKAHEYPLPLRTHARVVTERIGENDDAYHLSEDSLQRSCGGKHIVVKQPHVGASFGCKTESKAGVKHLARSAIQVARGRSKSNDSQRAVSNDPHPSQRSQSRSSRNSSRHSRRSEARSPSRGRSKGSRNSRSRSRIGFRRRSQSSNRDRSRRSTSRHSDLSSRSRSSSKDSRYSRSRSYGSRSPFRDRGKSQSSLNARSRSSKSRSVSNGNRNRRRSHSSHNRAQRKASVGRRRSSVSRSPGKPTLFKGDNRTAENRFMYVKRKSSAGQVPIHRGRRKSLNSRKFHLRSSRSRSRSSKSKRSYNDASPPRTRRVAISSASDSTGRDFHSARLSATEHSISTSGSSDASSCSSWASESEDSDPGYVLLSVAEAVKYLNEKNTVERMSIAVSNLPRKMRTKFS